MPGNQDELKASAASGNYLFAYFKGEGNDGLFLASSGDGYHWEPLNGGKAFLKPALGESKLMRDPCVCRGPDGVFHLTFGYGHWEKGVGVAHSKDLIHWSGQQIVPVMANEPGAANCWAPEIFYDDKENQFLIYWSTTIPGKFPATDATGDNGPKCKLNHRIYCVATKDFEKYSGAKLLYDGGFNVIDASIVKDGKRYLMLVKDETLLPQARKNIRIVFSDKAQGPYTELTDPISPSWVEGPTALKIGGAWNVYFDAYSSGRYRGVKSKDLKNWESIDDKINFPKGTRHGTAFAVSSEIAIKLKEFKGENAPLAPPGGR